MNQRITSPLGFRRTVYLGPGRTPIMIDWSGAGNATVTGDECIISKQHAELNQHKRAFIDLVKTLQREARAVA